MKAKSLLEKINKNEVKIVNSQSWDALMNATKVDVETMNTVSKELGYSDFAQMRITTNPNDLYNADSTKILNAFQHNLVASKINIDDLQKEFKKLADKFGVPQQQESTIPVANRALALIEKL